jgi:hippurate hydrolase
MKTLTQAVEKEIPGLLKIYKHFHSHPELSGQEVQTARRLALELRKIGFTVTEKFGSHGVVAVLRNGDGPTVMVRADMDALPITEETGLPYASRTVQKNAGNQTVGIMHACGHDIHMTTLLGTAQALKQFRDQWQGTLIFICQPSEEMLAGAADMIKAGLFRKFPVPDYLLALHVNPGLATGTIGFCEGYSWANVDIVEILVRGEGGHGAYPQKAKDPIVLASQLILALQTIVSREIPPTEPAVITVGSIHGGTQHNIIPDAVKLQVTIRNYSSVVRRQILAAIIRISRGLAQAAGLPPALYPVIDHKDSTPAVYNTPKFTRRLEQTARRLLGGGQVVKMKPEMGSEDFGCYSQVNKKIASCMFLLGSTPKGKSSPVLLHTGKFFTDPLPTLRTGIKTMASLVLDLLKL